MMMALVVEEKKSIAFSNIYYMYEYVVVRDVRTLLSSWISSVYLSCSSLGLPSGRPHSKVTQETPALTSRGARGRGGSVPIV